MDSLKGFYQQYVGWCGGCMDSLPTVGMTVIPETVEHLAALRSHNKAYLRAYAPPINSFFPSFLLSFFPNSLSYLSCVLPFVLPSLCRYSLNQNDKNCASCPPGASCRGGDHLEALDGYWMVPAATAATAAHGNASSIVGAVTRSEPIFTKCPHPLACVGNGTATGRVCDEERGYKNRCMPRAEDPTGACPLCTVCMDGFGKIGGDNECQKCPAKGVRILAFIGGLLACILYGGIVIWRKRVRYKRSTQYASVTRVFVNHCHIIALVGELRAPRSSGVMSAQFAALEVSMAAFGNLLSFECILDNSSIRSMPVRAV